MLDDFTHRQLEILFHSYLITLAISLVLIKLGCRFKLSLFSRNTELVTAVLGGVLPIVNYFLLLFLVFYMLMEFIHSYSGIVCSKTSDFIVRIFRGE